MCCPVYRKNVDRHNSQCCVLIVLNISISKTLKLIKVDVLFCLLTRINDDMSQTLTVTAAVYRNCTHQPAQVDEFSSSSKPTLTKRKAPLLPWVRSSTSWIYTSVGKSVDAVSCSSKQVMTNRTIPLRPWVMGSVSWIYTSAGTAIDVLSLFIVTLIHSKNKPAP